MDAPPTVRFVSLFVPDLEAAARTYESIFGVPASRADRTAPSPHPFAASGPIVFDLGQVRLALYECDPNRGTHAGDVGIGVCVSAGLEAIASRAARHGGRVFFGPEALADDGRAMAVFVLPDRHFFEILEGRDR